MTSSYTTRSRIIPGPYSQSEQWGVGGLVIQPHTNHSCQKTLSRGNPWRGSRKKNPLINVGGSFATKSVNVDLNPTPIKDKRNLGTYYEGTTGFVVSDVSNTNWTPSVETWAGNDWAGLDSRGATAVSRCAPTNSHADVAVALGELYREGLPKSALLTGRSRGKNLPARAADEYLGIQFGYLPLVRDVQSTVKALRRSGKILEQYARDSGKLVRRRYDFPEEKSTTYSTVADQRPWFLHYSSLTTPYQAQIVTSTVRRTWFSGAFTYHLLSGREMGWATPLLTEYQKINHLLGLRVGPDVLWNLVPWSWLVDWKTNIGDVLHNISMYQNDGLVMAYGYCMQETVTTREVRMGYGSSRGLNEIQFRANPCVITTTTKQRRAANPFGFGITQDSLSARQWSILAALGLSKGSARSLANDGSEM